MIKFGSRFELAFRRSLFTFLLLIAYLLLGSFLLSFFAKLEQTKRIAEECNNQREAQKGRRVDFERTELLNILWAESMTAKSGKIWEGTKLEVSGIYNDNEMASHRIWTNKILVRERGGLVGIGSSIGSKYIKLDITVELKYRCYT